MDTSVTIDSFGPLPVKRPASVVALCDLVKQTRGAKQAVYPIGGRTTLDVGLPPAKPGVACDTTALNAVIDYPARDMTITVQAGITLAAIQAELAKEGQWLPVDVPAPEKATLGGAVAVNASGPRRLGYGTLRDYVIGISFVTDDGVEVKAGGRVVKNVAGYDLMKLQIGALGTLGVVTQLTLKVKPKPEASAAVVFGCDSASLASVLDLLAVSKSRPVAVELLNQEAWRAGSVSDRSSDATWTIAVGFEEKSAAVRWQASTLLDELKAAPVRDAVELPDTSFCAALAALQLRAESRFIWKASVPPSKLAEVVCVLVAGTPYLVHADALNGVVWFHAPPNFDANSDPAVSWMEQKITTVGGHYSMRRCPTELKKTLRVWGKESSDRDLMRHVKKTLDPDNVFNPGRLFANI